MAREDGTVGCPKCYDTFASSLELLLDEIQMAPFHRGKSPQVSDARAQVQSQLQTKRALLRFSLQMEKYEDAAKLRDEIKRLEAQLTMIESHVP